MSDSPLSPNEGLKIASDYLRGSLIESLANPLTGAISKDDTQLSKFHGTYMQDDRDVRPERRRKKLEPAYSFMIRARIPAGVVTPKQWLELDHIAGTHANGSIRLTTRQAVQYHGVIKSNLKRTIAEINQALLDTLAACGDVNRNVMSACNVWQPELHRAAAELAQQVSDHLAPRTKAYHEIWLTDESGEKHQVTQDPLTVASLSAQEVRTGGTEVEPLYGKSYLPRKFKVVVAVPPSNDVDVFAHDLGFVAVVDELGELVGWNVMVGGGMGMTHGKKNTFPRIADELGFCTTEQAVAVAEAVMLTQRDFGDREDRSQARMKYTVERLGLEQFKTEVEARLGVELAPTRAIEFTRNGDRIGWIEAGGEHHLGLFISSGRVIDLEGWSLRSALRTLATELAEAENGARIRFILSPNQNLVLTGLSAAQRKRVDEVLNAHGVDPTARTGLRRNSMACVALPTCGLALAEAERYLPSLITDLEAVIDEAGLAQEEITIRMTGCPNGCARPFLAEIGFVGKGSGRYNLYLGGGFHGQRLNKLYLEDVRDEEIVAVLAPLLREFATEREAGERFGDWLVRVGYVAATVQGPDFHSNTGDLRELVRGGSE